MRLDRWAAVNVCRLQGKAPRAAQAPQKVSGLWFPSLADTKSSARFLSARVKLQSRQFVSARTMAKPSDDRAVQHALKQKKAKLKAKKLGALRVSAERCRETVNSE